MLFGKQYRIITISQLRDLGWIVSPDRFTKFRQLLPHHGTHEQLEFAGYPICTDGVHVIVWIPAIEEWFEAHYDNWNGKIEPAPDPQKVYKPKHIALKEEKDKPLRQSKAYLKMNPNKITDSDVDDLC